MVPDRRSLGFVDAVRSAFGFLVADLGFDVADTDVTRVRYESDRMFVHVYHGRRSYAIGIEVGNRHERDAPGYGLAEVLGAILGDS